jgi:hypothetical protein
VPLFGLRLGLRFGHSVVQHLQQSAGIKLKATGAELQGLPAHQPGQAGRQLHGAWHPRSLNQDRDHPDVAGQGRLNLQPHKVSRVIKATPTVLVGDGQPLVPDQCQQHIAGADRCGDHLGEVITQLDRVDVLEDLPVGEAVSQPVIQPAGRVGGVLPAVADEDPT